MIKEHLKMVKLYDVFIILLLISFSFLPMIIFANQEINVAGGNVYAVISISGKEVDRFLLTGNTERQLMTYYPAPGKYNILEIDGERIRNKEDNSPHQIAVQRDWIQLPGETSLNLPHQLLIEIVSENPEDLEIDVIVQ